MSKDNVSLSFLSESLKDERRGIIFVKNVIFALAENFDKVDGVFSLDEYHTFKRHLFLLSETKIGSLFWLLRLQNVQ